MSTPSGSWRGKDSNLRSQWRQIYSLVPLTAREPLHRRSRRAKALPAPNVFAVFCPPDRLSSLMNAPRELAMGLEPATC